jgi:hypothetical protein
MGGVLVPTFIGGASSWSVADWLEKEATSDPATGGLATITFPQLASDERWLIERAVCYCDSSTATTLRLYRSGLAPTALRSGSDTGNFDEADYPRGLVLFEGSQLIAQWSGASTGARGVLTLQVQKLVRA